MKMGYLADHFEGVAAKVLSTVETAGRSSNQHELDGVRSLIDLFGSPAGKLRLTTSFMWMSDEDIEPEVEDGQLTFYDARERTLGRTEFRLYYPASIDAMKRAEPGDVVFIARQTDGPVLFIVTPAGSTAAAQLDWLFGTNVFTHDGFSVRSQLTTHNDRLGLSALYLLDVLGIAAEPTDDHWLERILNRFGPRFPTSAEFGAFARSTLPNMHPADGPDEVLIAWLEQEELLFRTLERHLTRNTLQQLYGQGVVDVDRFVEVSLSIHNRRKSRAGKSLENQLIALFGALGVGHSFNPITENRTRPDFVFPSIQMYLDESFPADRLTMLGVKTTCKDRWRQILSEAKRIDNKHLLTLESPISLGQTNEMQANGLQLVVPKALHAPYNKEQKNWLMDVADFIALAKERDFKDASRLFD